MSAKDLDKFDDLLLKKEIEAMKVQCPANISVALYEVLTSFAEKHCGSSLSSWHIIGTLLISKLFTSFVPICSQLRLYICYLREFVKNKTHRFQCFSANDVIIKKVYIHRQRRDLLSIFWNQRDLNNKIGLNDLEKDEEKLHKWRRGDAYEQSLVMRLQEQRV